MKYVILGGTGTLGTCLIEKLSVGANEVVCFSRDELKQQEMRKRFPNVRYVIGDIRDKNSLRPVLADAYAVFHVAALKHVDVLEANPTEAIKTNVLGTINVAEAAVEAGVKYVVFSSTDKAVLPINTYGMTKATSERYLLNLNVHQDKTQFSVFRWGNVMGSRGSVVHLFAKSIQDEKMVSVTDPRMTRFWIHIKDAVDFMLENFKSASPSDVMIPRMKAAGVLDLAASTAKAIGASSKYRINLVGMRPGEKVHEVLFSSHEYCIRSDTAEKYTEAELTDLVKRSLSA
jgi:UDP-N-acetylglucosamine 4,6-dehydratase